MEYYYRKGRYQKEVDLLISKLVPDIWKSKTEHWELLRLMSNFIYQLYELNLCNYGAFKNEFEDLILKLEEFEWDYSVDIFINLLNDYINTIESMSVLDIDNFYNNFYAIWIDIEETYEIIIKYVYEKEFWKML